MTDLNDLPLLTIGVLSWNRLHYLRATLESAHRCIKYPKIQWIVVDNCSTEPGLADYLRGLSWVDDLIFLESDHVTAMNEIVSRARGEVLLIWPDDMQFIVEGDWMIDCVEILMRHKSLGSMGLNCQRRLTIQRNWGKRKFAHDRVKAVWSEIKKFGVRFRFQRKLISARGFPVLTYGWLTEGIVGSGIPSLARTEVWKTMGPWKAKKGENNLVDSSGGGETEMLERWHKMKIPWQRAMPVLPVSADILTDPTGTKAKVRGKDRFGVYVPPQGNYYYQIRSQAECEDRLKHLLPAPFEEFVIPLGFNLPLDEEGNLLKASLNTAIKTSIS